MHTEILVLEAIWIHVVVTAKSPYVATATCGEIETCAVTVIFAVTLIYVGIWKDLYVVGSGNICEGSVICEERVIGNVKGEGVWDWVSL